MNQYKLVDPKILIKPMFFKCLMNMLFIAWMILKIIEGIFILKGYLAMVLWWVFLKENVLSWIFDGSWQWKSFIYENKLNDEMRHVIAN